MEKRPIKKKITELTSKLLLDLMDETTPVHKLHVISNEYMAQMSKTKKRKNGN